MELNFRQDYTKITDKEIVNLIIAQPPNEEVALYLIYVKYKPMITNMYQYFFKKNWEWYDDCFDDIFAYLKDNEPYWEKLRSFQWRSSLSTWLRRVAFNRICKFRQELIDSKIIVITTNDDDDSEEYGQPTGWIDNQQDRDEVRSYLAQAIRMLKDTDQQFVVIKHLEGYSSKEIAVLMMESWQERGIQKYDKNQRPIVPTDGYVNVKMQRAKENLKEILVKYFN